MKILYIADVRMPTEKAHGLQIMKMCEAFAKLGHEIELVVPWRLNPIRDDPFEYYGIHHRFRITKVPSIDLVRFGRIGFWIHQLTFSVSAFFLAVSRDVRIVYSRNEISLVLLGLSTKKLFWEIHAPRWNVFVRYLLPKLSGAITISEGLKNFYTKKKGGTANFLVVHDGVDAELFSVKETREACRKRLGLPLDKKLVVYTGHLYSWKGVGTLAQAAWDLPDNALVIFVGGTDQDLSLFRSTYGAEEHVQIMGREPHTKMPYYLKAADVLVLPNSAKDAASARYTSPLKLFEYMASGTPIVVSDVPALREVLAERSALFVEPDNPQTLAEGIRHVLGAKSESTARATQALMDVQTYTWKERAQRILDFIYRH